MIQRYLKDQFESKIISRGNSYFREKRCELVSHTKSTAHFLVEGSEIYHCHFYWTDKPVKKNQGLAGDIDMSCECRYFLDRGLCKHLWASIRKGDSQRIWKSFLANRRNLTAGIGAGIQKKKVAHKSWEKKLNSFSKTLNRKTELPELYYMVSALSDDIFVRYYQKIDDILSPITIKSSQISFLKDSMDRELVWMLIPRDNQNDFYYDPNPNYSHGIINPCLESHVLERLCSTGRAFSGYLNKSYNVDEVKYLEFVPDVGKLLAEVSVVNEKIKVGGKISFTNLSIDISELKYFSDHGSVICDTKVGKIDLDYADWINILKSLKGETIQKRDKDLLVQALCSKENIPEITLDPELGWEVTDKILPTPKMIIKDEGQKIRGRSELYGGVHFKYGDAVVFSQSNQKYAVDIENRKLFARNQSSEKELIDEATSLGLSEAPGNLTDIYNFRIRVNGFISTMKSLIDKSWEVEAHGRKVETAKKFDFSVTSGVDWFDLEGGVSFESGQLITLPELMKSIQQGEKLISLGNGKVGMLPEKWLEKYSGLTEIGTETQNGSLRFTRAQGLFLDGWFEGENNFKSDEGFNDFKKRLKRASLVKKAKPLKVFKGELRDYQEEGLSWLQYLSSLGFGGILADDMGLGKTVQVIALMQKQCWKKASDEMTPNLIVVPKSLVFNWIDELQKFAPNLSVLNYTGSNRRENISDIDIKKSNIIVTTYHTLRNDFDRLSATLFSYIILDEAQTIKNPESQVSKACKALAGKQKLALTGTPIENSIMDLFSILDFVNPGLISEKNRQSFFGNNDSNGENLKKLSRAISPLILRRTKGQVLTELPDKVESTIKCELSKPEQRQYDQLKKYYQLKLSNKIKEKGFGRSKIEILEALLRLRQAACHPALLDEKKINSRSTKVDTLFDQLRSLASTGSKCLVFSQFTSFLEVIRPKLEKQNIRYLYLDGKTRKRKELVKEFENDNEIKVFLISLKAGGVGLNLTSANYVFILDPWWNPAAESQAIDRTHRMGQKNNVFAYKLIAKNTVEEKILELQASKKELSDAVINTQSGMLKKLSMNDLNFLLS